MAAAINLRAMTMLARLLVFPLLLFATYAQAASSAWVTTDGARLRLISMVDPATSRMLAAMQVDLEPGWKTYWREPGASGIPPHIHFLGSSNVGAPVLNFPVPKVFREADGTSIGYKTRVLFPVSVTRGLPSNPATLSVTGVIGVCAEICVPFQFASKVVQQPGERPAPEISRLLQQANFAQGLAENTGDFVETVSIVSLPSGRPRHIEILVKADGAAEAELLPEGPSGWYLQPGKGVALADGRHRFEIDLRDVPGGAKVAGQTIKLTLVAGDRSFEQSIRLPSAKSP